MIARSAVWSAKPSEGLHSMGIIRPDPFHDLELTDLENEVPSLINTHFQETVSNGALAFDYQLRPGSCPTTNALRIMELEGLPIPKPASPEAH